MKNASRGFLTIAYGPEKYIRMVEALIRSYRRFNPTLPFAVVTDEFNHARLSKLFDVVIPVNYDYGKGVVQKLHADMYSPFNETLFVDSDCIFYKSPDILWKSYQHGGFCVRGWRYLTGSTDYEKSSPYEWVKDTTKFLADNGIARLPHFNSGAFYFDQDEVARSVFSGAREVYENRDALGFTKFKNAPIADEPAFAVAMEKCQVEMMPWDPINGMETAINIERIVEVDVLKGVAQFYKSGSLREPALLHFNVNAQLSVVYNREILKLRAPGSSSKNFNLRAKLIARMSKNYSIRALEIVRKLPGFIIKRANRLARS